MPEKNSEPTVIEARVISRYGNRADIRWEGGDKARCAIRRNLSHLVCGDRVSVKQDKNQWVIESIKPRDSVFERPLPYEGVKAVAANVDQLVIVNAILPQYSSQILDRYLCIAEHAGISPIIVFNKMDLLDQEQTLQFKSDTANYENLGYSCFYLQATAHDSQAELTPILAALEEALKAKTSIFVGQSGVGKSSLLNYFLGEDIEAAATQAVSENSGLGTHTTTVSRLYELDNDIAIIDSPGIREFPLNHLDARSIERGFIEFHELEEPCHFRNCSHINEPKCAVKKAVKQERISPERYQNYCQIMASLDP